MAERVSSGLMNVPAILPYLRHKQQAAIVSRKETMTAQFCGGASETDRPMSINRHPGEALPHQP